LQTQQIITELAQNLVYNEAAVLNRQPKRQLSLPEETQNKDKSPRLEARDEPMEITDNLKQFSLQEQVKSMEIDSQVQVAPKDNN
jgi:hypothetical protein